MPSQVVEEVTIIKIIDWAQKHKKSIKQLTKSDIREAIKNKSTTQGFSSASLN